MKNIKKLKRLMHAANCLRKNNPLILRGTPISSSQALKYAWWFESFRAQLRTGVFRFSYFKKEGSIREARGTLNQSLIPTDKHPKPSNDQRPTTNDTFVYFDLDRNSWRSFRLDHFIGFVSPLDR